MARILLNTQLITSPPSYKSAIAVPPQSSPPGSDIALIIAAFLCALVCCVGLFAFVRCAWLRRISTASAQRFGCQLATNRGGLKKKDVQRLPKYVYGSSSSSGNADADTSVDCVICLTEYTEGDEIRVLPQCEHVFHVQCIDTWLSSHSSCPSCRQVIVVVAGCQNCCEIPECLRSTATTSTATPECLPSTVTPECLRSTATTSIAAMSTTPAVTVPIKAGSGYGLPSTATTSTATPAVTVPIKA